MSFNFDFDDPREEHIRQEVWDLREAIEEEERDPIGPDEFSEMVLNTWEREHLFPVLSNEALIERLEYYLSHCGKQPTKYECATTYNEAVLYRLAPELVDRLKDEE
jgi:hypothetical protein